MSEKMPPLSSLQKQLVFDQAMGLAADPENKAVAELIASNLEAARIDAAVKRSLTPLNSLAEPDCPDYLVESTVWRLKTATASGPTLDQLLAGEQARQTAQTGQPWHNIGRMAATAAVIILMASALFPPLKSARERSWQQMCGMQVEKIWNGTTNYCNDHDGRMPTVMFRKGQPWWKVGCPGEQNHSNTRRMWLLVKNHYVEPTLFVCPGIRHGRAIQIGWAQAAEYDDFPARRYVTYSNIIQCEEPQYSQIKFRKVIMADMNPLFERIPEDFGKKFHVRCNERLMTRNSSNHHGLGQSILFSDGSVEFVKGRRVGIAADDIYTLRGTSVYRGVEVPSCQTDTFLAP